LALAAFQDLRAVPPAYTPSSPAAERPLPPQRARPARPPTPAVEPVGANMVNAMRVILAVSALMVMHIAPFASERLTTLTYVSLIAYCAYSILLYTAGKREQGLPSTRINHWADVFFYAYLVALTGGAASVFFFFFFFPILVASFSAGYREGLFVTVTSVALFLLVGFTVPSAGSQFQFGELAIRPVYLTTLGYMLAYWGGYEMMLKRRMTLLNEVNNLWNPRFGVDHTIGINLDRLLEYHGATSCVLLLQRPTTPATYLLYSASAHRPGRLVLPSMIPESTARKLLRLPDAYAATYHDPNGSAWFRKGVRLAGYDLESRNRNGTPVEACREIATLLDTRTFVTVPYSERDGTVGRLFVASEDRPFDHSDIEFLAQFAATISPVIESMHLMDELVSRASEHERFKISRDIHDTTIQPYIGLKLGLDALYREAGENGPHSHRIGELIEMANLTIRDLRVYAATLREGAPLPGEFLVSAVQRQAERLERFYGIQVEVKSDINGHLSSRLAAEAFQIVSEGLSNVLRHTQARHAFAHILCEEENLLLKVGNEEARPADEVPDFTPRSIYERVESLGGETGVEKGVDGCTVVHVNIPI
jgi:signal transduction histidine kinase